MKKAPLAGIRIIEVGQLLAVPFAARMLADLGAEVIKVESPLRLDSYRRTSFPDNEPGENYWDRGGTFYNENRGKLGISLDLRVPEAREVFIDLVRVSDVLMENYTPRVMTNFGFDYESLQEINPRLIMLSSTGYGHTGPWANYRAANPTTEGASGLASLTGYADGPPVLPDVPHTDYVAAEQAVLAVLLALFRRRRTGKGSAIDLSQVEAQASLIGEHFLDAAANEVSPTRRANRHPAIAPHGIFPCRGNDRWIAIAVTTDDQFRGLRAAMGDPQWAAAQCFESAAGRLESLDELEQQLGDWTRGKEPMSLMWSLQSQGIPAGAVLDGRDLVLNEHLKARDFFRWFGHPASAGIEPKPHPGAAWHFSESAHGVRLRAPGFSEHNELVLRSLLGYTPERISRLGEVAAFGGSPAQLPRPFPVSLSTLLDHERLVEIDSDFKLRIANAGLSQTEQA